MLGTVFLFALFDATFYKRKNFVLLTFLMLLWGHLNINFRFFLIFKLDSLELLINFLFLPKISFFLNRFLCNINSLFKFFFCLFNLLNFVHFLKVIDHVVNVDLGLRIFAFIINFTIFFFDCIFICEFLLIFVQIWLFRLWRYAKFCGFLILSFLF